MVYVGVIRCIYPVLSLLLNGVLDVPLRLLRGLTACGHLLHVDHDHIYCRCFSPIVGGALVGVVVWLIAIKAGDGCRGTGVAVLEVGLW